MKLLKEKILKNGEIINPTTLKVDSFLNHQIDPIIMMEMGKELKKKFEGKKINKILTIEASGIAIGLAAAVAFDVPLVFAKKKKPTTMDGMYFEKVHSFTKKVDYDICVSKEFLNSEDKILFVDDFLATGNAIIGIQKIIEQAGAELIGIGIAIEKGFQPGGNILRNQGIHLESLAIIDKMELGKINFI
ncbi:xanthine phosphoribosyltransferase [uncultured Ilyobacter sp.]|uniref:xanthine phosphoribosyltransferase n=1 Tax=uncultured Ilyobacter sp. TaxID=544433 RepID=UPI0029C80B3F|nr:xanthine phosphoribosyltransferase [uncultured Ilyobacter sp.]